MEEPDIIISPLSVRQAGFQGFLCFTFHVAKGFTLRWCILPFQGLNSLSTNFDEEPKSFFAKSFVYLDVLFVNQYYFRGLTLL